MHSFSINGSPKCGGETSVWPRGRLAAHHRYLPLRPVPVVQATQQHAQATASPVPLPSGLSCPVSCTAAMSPVPRPGATAHQAGRGLIRAHSAGAVVVDLLGRELTGEEAALWQASCQVLSDSLGLSSEEAQRLLARAFGWTTQAFWRREKVEEVPTPDQVSGALAFLRDDLDMAPEEQLKTVKVFPEVLACEVEGRLRANTAQLQSQWRLQGPTLTKAVLRQPQVLGYSVDCGGDCVGECNRCWARF